MTLQEAKLFLARATREGAWFSLLDGSGNPTGPDVVDFAAVTVQGGKDMLNVRLAGYEQDAHLNHLAQVAEFREGWDSFVLDGTLASGQEFRIEIIDKDSEPFVWARLQEWRWMQQNNPELYQSARVQALAQIREAA